MVPRSAEPCLASGAKLPSPVGLGAGKYTEFFQPIGTVLDKWFAPDAGANWRPMIRSIRLFKDANLAATNNHRPIQSSRFVALLASICIYIVLAALTT